MFTSELAHPVTASKSKLSILESFGMGTVVRKVIHSHCQRKKRYQTKAEAIEKVQELLDNTFKNQDFCTVYHCKFCGGWHFSSCEAPGETKGNIREKSRACRKNIRRRRKVYQMMIDHGLIDMKSTFLVCRDSVSNYLSS